MPALLALALAMVGVAPPAGAASASPERPAPPPSGRYAVRAVDPGNLLLAAPKLPDLARYNRAAVEAKIESKPAARVRTARMVEESALREFVGRGGLGQWAARQGTNPVAIFVDGGYITLPVLAKELGAGNLQEGPQGVFTLRRPLVIRAGATLHVGAPVKELRLSRSRGAFLVNDGSLFVTGTRVTGWDEGSNSAAEFRQPAEFRPFIAARGGSKTYIADSVVSHLGYDASRSYGVSLVLQPAQGDAKTRRPAPTGWIIGSEFFDNWYGFYSDAAEDVVIAGNNFHDNRVHGINPHDHSKRLIVAGNQSSGLTQKHGIILSRNVSDSWIFRNKITGNQLGGIVLDRNSFNNVVADNVTSANQGDGITICESSDNLVWGNRSVGNSRHGIRLRNSVGIRLYDNVVAGNKLAGLYGHVKDLTGTDRKDEVPPLTRPISIIVVGGQLTFNGSGPVSLDVPLSAKLFNVDLLGPIRTGGLRLPGVLGELQHEVLDILVRRKLAAVIEPAGKAKPAAPVRTAAGGRE